MLPSDWQERRIRVFKRDGFRCVYCGKKGELHCDHIIPPSEGGSHEEWNLRTVCRDHHLEWHPEKAAKYNYFYKRSVLVAICVKRIGRSWEQGTEYYASCCKDCEASKVRGAPRGSAGSSG